MLLIIELFFPLHVISLFPVVKNNLDALAWVFSCCCNFFDSSCTEFFDFLMLFNLVLSILSIQNPKNVTWNLVPFNLIIMWLSSSIFWFWSHLKHSQTSCLAVLTKNKLISLRTFFIFGWSSLYSKVNSLN